MLKIRLQRVGRINDPSYRLVVTEHARSTKTGKIIERVGSYNPKTKERILVADRIKYWISVGAQASGTVHNMLISEKIIEGKKINVLPQKSPPKDSEQKAENSEQGTQEVKKAEAPVEETPSEAAPEAPEVAEASVESEAPAA